MKNTLKNILEEKAYYYKNKNNLYLSVNSSDSKFKDSDYSKGTDQNFNKVCFLQFSGRLGGVKMARSLTEYGEGKNSLNKKIYKRQGIKPQTLDTCLIPNKKGSWRLQYIKKNIYTKWGVLGLKLWLYTKS